MMPVRSFKYGAALVLAGALLLLPNGHAQSGNAGSAESLEQQGARLAATGNILAAVKSWQQSLQMRRQLLDRGGEARLLGTIGMAYFEHGNYLAAIDYFQPFAVLTHELRERRAEGVAQTYLGNALVFVSRYSQAESTLNAALPIVREFDDRPGEGVVLSGLATAEFNLGRYTNAQGSFERLLDLGAQLADAQLTGFALVGLANVADRLGKGAQALALYEQALRSAEAVGDLRTQGRAHGGIGNVCLGRGDYALALASYQRSLSLALEAHDREGEANAQGNLGNLYSLTGQRASAVRAQQASLKIARARGDRQGEMEALIGVGLAAERSKDKRGAIDAYQSAYNISRQAQNRPGSVVALTNLGGVLQAVGSLESSEQALREAVRLTDEMREEDLIDLDRVSFFETQLTTYRLLRDVLVARNDPAALESAERGRAQALRVQIAKRLTRQDAEGIRQAPPPTLQRIRQLAIGSAMTLVEYAIDAKQKLLLMWVVRSDGDIQLRRTVITGSLAELIVATRESIGAIGLDRSARARGIIIVAGDHGSYAPRLQTLYQLLIAPIEDLLPTDPLQVVVFIPEQELFLIPFAALMDPSGEFLIDRHSVASSPSMAVTMLSGNGQVRARSIRGNDVLIVGNPTMPQVRASQQGTAVQLPALPGTEFEAREIAKLFGSRTLLGAQATKKRVTQGMASARFVHLATHGLLDDFGSGIPGAVALAPGDGDSGLLTAAEISGLNVKAELVVLSACDTGLGQLSGDGIVGLSRALLTAGAASTLLSLWQVPDEATAELMIAFYQQLREKAGKAQALRAAMLAVKSRHADPANWAAFVLTGADAGSRPESQPAPRRPAAR